MSETLDFKRIIREGDTIAWAGGTAEPSHSLAQLNAQIDELPRATALINLSLSETVDAARFARRMHVKALGGAGTNRRFQDAGALDVLPAHYSALPELVAQGVIKIDVAMVQLAGDEGDLRLTPALDHVRGCGAAGARGHRRAERPGARADGRYQRCAGRYRSPAARVLSRDRGEGDAARPGGTRHRRARRAHDPGRGDAAGGPRHACPMRCWRRSTGKKDLGLHSGTIADGVAKLVDAGVITNRLSPSTRG